MAKFQIGSKIVRSSVCRQHADYKCNVQLINVEHFFMDFSTKMYLPQEVLDLVLLFLPIRYAISHSNEFVKKRCLCNMFHYSWKSLDIEGLRWIKSYNVKAYSPEICELAAREGCLDLVKWLHQNRMERIHDEPTMLSWLLHKSKDKGCKEHIGALRSGAANGHVDIVKFLHEETDVECDLSPMVYAATYGHLDLVKWLYYNCSHARTYDVSIFAEQSGHLHVVNWLAEQEAKPVDITKSEKWYCKPIRFLKRFF